MPTYPTRLHQWFEEVWNNANRNFIDEMLDENVIAHGLNVNDQPMRGAAGFKTFYDMFRESFPKVFVEIEHLFKTDEFEAAYCYVTVWHVTRGKAHFTGLVVGRFNGNKLVEGWNAFDFLKMNTDIGFKLVAESQVTS